jgi:site-specific DNA-methyltransferase (adenine-specific)
MILENGHLKINEVYQGDCLELMKFIPDKSIDAIISDPPYGTTACKWDTIIPFEPLWEQYKRIIKDNGAIVLTASQPFTSALVMSNIKMFKYEWIWEKSRATGFQNSKYAPMRNHENIVVFYKNKPLFTQVNIKKLDKPISSWRKNGKGGNLLSGVNTYGKDKMQELTGYAKTIIKINNEHNVGKQIHPTQKPVALFEYLIKTYTNEGDLVLDNCMGSGTTGVACKNTGRNFIGIELDQTYFNIAKKRINDTRSLFYQ